MIEVDYGYANARIRGMKSRLLDHKALDGLIAVPEVDALIVELEKTPYQPDIAEASTRYAGIYCVEYALRRNYTRMFRQILGFFKDSPAEAYVRTYLRKWDIQNIKTILRGISFHVAGSEIFECLVPAGDLDDVTLGEMIKQPDVKAVVDLLATWRVEYARPLTRHFKEYADVKDMMVLENALDQYYYGQALAALGGGSYDERLVRDQLEVEVDVVNIKTVLRMIRDQIEAGESARYMLQGGKMLRLEQIVRLLEARSLEEAVRQLKGTRYGFLAETPPEAYKDDNISELEKRLDRYLIKRGLGSFAGDPLSIAIAIGYFWAKLNEITNLRIIARCKTSDISDESLRGELFYV